ncbi:MAG TPA: phosphatase PAP2 family protein [Anaeromyxobacteraceae bacterium]|nr:phosphatase PAP2 family protein [Anaeromyxobacteraceae bacterium]
MREPSETAPMALTATAAGTAVPGVPAGPVPTERTGRLARLLAVDERLLVAARRLHGPWRTRVARALTRAGDTSSWTAVTLLLLAAGGEWRMLGFRLAAATLLGTLLSQALKRSLLRPRPTSAIHGFEALAENPDRFSFPSGHTTAAFAAAVALAGAPHGVGIAAAALACGIAASRGYLGAHYPLDVAAGLVLGSLAGAAARIGLAFAGA